MSWELRCSDGVLSLDSALVAVLHSAGVNVAGLHERHAEIQDANQALWSAVVSRSLAKRIFGVFGEVPGAYRLTLEYETGLDWTLSGYTPPGTEPYIDDPVVAWSMSLDKNIRAQLEFWGFAGAGADLAGGISPPYGARETLANIFGNSGCFEQGARLFRKIPDRKYGPSPNTWWSLWEV